MPLLPCECVAGLPTQQQLANIYCALYTLSGTFPPSGASALALARTVIFASNSIGQPYGLVGDVSFPNLYAASQQAVADTVIQYVGPANTPNPCDSLTDTIANYATTIGLYTQAKTGRPLLVILPNAGSSDVINGGDTAAQIYTKLQTLVGMIHADGGKVLVGNICPGSYYAGAVDTRRLAVNTLIESDLTLFDYFWPMAATHSVDTSPLYGADNQHWSPLGHIVAAAELMLAQNDYYQNGSFTPLRNNSIIRNFAMLMRSPRPLRNEEN